VRHAAGEGGQIVLLQELFETPYFEQDQKQKFFALAAPVEDHPVLRPISALAVKLEVVLPVSFFERANDACYNSLAMITSTRQPPSLSQRP
jgi:N-carbamoylputrescine amidase